MESIDPTTAPESWADYCWHTESRLHQLSPYIGKLKSTIARDLVISHTQPGDTVLDPFCGSGTVPLECALANRRVFAADVNPYAYVLTRAKLQPPTTLASGLARLDLALASARERPAPDLRKIPRWVRRFFHPETLRETLQFADECIARKEYYLPCFLSFPSIHLVPYLRTRKFPQSQFPEMYERRELHPRMVKKVTRALESPLDLSTVNAVRGLVRKTPVENLQLDTRLDAIITSPPYMNALDYVRDNRLRMWLLDRSTADYSPEPTEKLLSFQCTIMAFIRAAVPHLKRGGKCILVVGETVRRKRAKSHPAEMLLAWLRELAPELRLLEVLRDSIPDVRRARRDGQATKKELILVLRKD
jgi:methylase of polypeptide subunit release factors